MSKKAIIILLSVFLIIETTVSGIVLIYYMKTNAFLREQNNVIEVHLEIANQQIEMAEQQIEILQERDSTQHK